MPLIQDHDYLKLCAELARKLSISLASARRKVDLIAAKEGVRDLESYKSIVHRLINQLESLKGEGEESSANQLDQLLEALADEENFMVED